MTQITKHASAFTATTGFDNTYTDPANAYVDDSNYATTSTARNKENATCWRGFDFSSIPAGATINSVNVFIKHLVDVSWAQGTWRLSVWADASTGAPLSPGVTGAIGPDGEYTKASTNTSEDTWDTLLTGTIPTLAQLKGTNFGIRVESAQGNNGTVHNWSINDIYITVDYTASADIPASQAESETVADLESAVNIGVGSQAESGTGVDTKAAIMIALASISEVGTGVEVNSATIITSSSISETESAAEVTDGGLLAEVAISEEETALDTIDAIIVITGSIDELETVVDSQSAIVIANADISESETAIDSNLASSVYPVFREESELVVDSTGALKIASGDIIEAITGIEIESAAKETAVGINETSSAVDETDGTIAAGIVSGSISESSSITEILSAVVISIASNSEQGTAEDIIGNQLISAADIIETAFGSENINAVSNLLAAQIEVGNAIDISTAGVIVLGAIIESVNAIGVYGATIEGQQEQPKILLNGSVVEILLSGSNSTIELEGTINEIELEGSINE